MLYVLWSSNGILTSCSSVQTIPLLQLPLLQHLATGATCWIGAGATMTATMTGIAITMPTMVGAAGFAAGAATMAMTMTVGVLPDQTHKQHLLLCLLPLEYRQEPVKLLDCDSASSCLQ